jgi:L-arabinose isomerase
MKAILNVGLMGIGLDTYWDQFEGLKDRLLGYVSIVENKMKGYGARVINVGMVDNIDKSFEAANTLRSGCTDILIIYTTTYALSSTVLPIVQACKAPVLILNLSPEGAINYNYLNNLSDRTKMTGEWLAYCGACPVPEIANVLKRGGYKFYEITGVLNDDKTWNEVGSWIEAAKVKKIMSLNRLGLMGHYYSGMLDIYSDTTLQMLTFGGHIEILEVDELSSIKRSISNEAITKKIEEIKSSFDVQSDCSDFELERAAKTSAALDIMAEQYKLGSMAYYYKGSGVPENEDTMSSIILGTSLLTSRNIPVAGEYEVKNVQAMKIMDALGVGGSFTEYYAMDFNEDIVLMGHDGPGHMSIAEGKIKVKPLQVYHGKVGSGLSVEMSVKNGPITCFSIIEHEQGKLAFLVAEGESVPGPILEIGNTNSRYRFSCGAEQFMKKWNSYGPAHHCAIGIGHVGESLTKLAALLDIAVFKVV